MDITSSTMKKRKNQRQTLERVERFSMAIRPAAPRPETANPVNGTLTRPSTWATLADRPMTRSGEGMAQAGEAVHSRSAADHRGRKGKRLFI